MVRYALFVGSAPLLTRITENKPIHKQHPQWIDSTPVRTDHCQVLVPPFSGAAAADMPASELHENLGDLSEWIGMVQIGSPRVSANDDVDPYLSRYEVPNSEKSTTTDLVSLKWRGLISSAWTMKLLQSLV